MTLLALNSRIGKLALIAAAIAIVALATLGAPGAAEASGGMQTAAATPDNVLHSIGQFFFNLIRFLFG